MQHSAETGGNGEGNLRAAFQGTRWSVVVLARGTDAAAQKALSELCRLYWYPLYAFVRRSGHGHHEAEDLTQGFFQHIIEGDGLANVNQSKGRFRSFLLSSIKNFMANERERAGTLKRGGDQVLVSIDMKDADGRYECEPADESTPETIYQRQWAMTVLGSVLNTLGKEYERKGRKELFDVLQGHIAGGDRQSVSYAEVAKRLEISEGNLKILVHRMRRRFGEILRSEIAQTVESNSDVDGEIRHLMSCLS